MQSALPSNTALRVALRRAAHQLYDPPPRIFDDPIAVPILGRKYLPELHKTATRIQKPFSAALRAFLVARSRYAEDQLARAVSRGVTQYVLLGAGLDTFAHRNPHPTLRVFEVDHSATQQWKRDLLDTTRLPAPANLTYVPVDFESQSLPEQLKIAGYDPRLPTVFAWLGVVPYLTLDAFRATVSYIAAHPPGTVLVLDYGQPREVLPFLEQLAHDSLASRVALAGEPFRLFFTPTLIAAELAAFPYREDLDTLEINARYFAGRRDNLRLRGSAGHLLTVRL